MKKYLLLVFFLIIHLAILSFLQFTAWPEMVSFPYLINHGFITYRDMVHAYPPLLIEVLSIIYKIFGYNVFILKIFGWTSFIINDVLIFVLISKLTKKENIAYFGIFIYIILQPVLDGNMVWPDLIIIPFLLGGIITLVNKKYFLSGIIFALAFLTKQTALLYIAVSLFYVCFTGKLFRSCLNFFIGILIVIIPFVLSLISQQSLNDFVNWTIIYPSKYWTKFPGYVQLNPTLRENIILFLLLFPLAFLIFKVNRKVITNNLFLLLFAFLVCGIIGIYPRFSFFHFQPGLAVLVILLSYLIVLTKIKPFYLLISVVLVVIFSLNHFVFGGNRFWGDNDLVLAKQIQNDALKSEPIYLLGLDSNLYAFSNRVPSKPWLDNFGWYLEIPQVQEKMIAGFEHERPSVIFWEVPQTGNWYDIGVYQPTKITDWIIKNYSKKKEIMKGVWEWTKK